VHIFGLKKTDAYVLRFLELVLEFVGKHDSSIRSFLNWWDESNIEEKTSVITSETGNAIRIMSIHKSKGLQFPVVIMPFTDWKLQPDARDVMWIDSKDAPFSSFGKIPLSPNKAMKESCFADSYQNEMIQAVTDNINLMYVAFTRAEEELYIFTAAGDIKEINSTGKLLRTVLQSVPEWSEKFDENHALLLGELRDKNAKEEQQPQRQVHGDAGCVLREGIKRQRHPAAVGDGTGSAGVLRTPARRNPDPSVQDRR